MSKSTANGSKFLLYYPNGPVTERGDTGPTITDLKSIAASKYFSNVVIGQGHFSSSASSYKGKPYPAGTLYWNDVPLPEVDSAVWTAVEDVGANKPVSLQLGSGGNGTWPWITANNDQAATNLLAALKAYPLSGIDLDPEPSPTAAAVRDLTTQLGTLKSNHPFLLSQVPVPWAAYFSDLYSPAFWSPMAPYVDWVTPQWYGNSGLVSAYNDFVTGHTTGQTFSADIILAGQDTDSANFGDVPSYLTDIGNAHPGFGGVGVWQYTGLDDAMNRAIYDALHPS